MEIVYLWQWEAEEAECCCDAKEHVWPTCYLGEAEGLLQQAVVPEEHGQEACGQTEGQWAAYQAEPFPVLAEQAGEGAGQVQEVQQAEEQGQAGVAEEAAENCAPNFDWN